MQLPTIKQMKVRANSGHRLALERLLADKSLCDAASPDSSIRGMRVVFATLRRWQCVDVDGTVTERGHALLSELVRK